MRFCKGEGGRGVENRLKNSVSHGAITLTLCEGQTERGGQVGQKSACPLATLACALFGAHPPERTVARGGRFAFREFVGEKEKNCFAGRGDSRVFPQPAAGHWELTLTLFSFGPSRCCQRAVTCATVNGATAWCFVGNAVLLRRHPRARFLSPSLCGISRRWRDARRSCVGGEFYVVLLPMFCEPRHFQYPRRPVNSA